MRICIPQIAGHRGAGLGNELFPWAKAFLAGQVLDAHVMSPAWSLNPRRYYRDFGTGRTDWMRQAALRALLPTVHFDESAYQATGKIAYQDAVAQFAAAQGLERHSHFVLVASGMWGGFRAIEHARTFVLAELLKARRVVANVYAVLGQVRSGRILVAVHIRRGDFVKIDRRDDYRGRFNVALPLEWYLATCASLRRACGDRIDFLLVTDAEREDVRPFIDAFHPLTTFHQKQTACSDLLLLAFADALVCSVSSYSMWGAFLSRAPYIWCSANLQEHQGYASLWGHEVAQAPELPEVPGSTRALAVDWSGTIPACFTERLLASARERASEKDLMLYGVVPLARRAGTAERDCA